MGAISSVAAEKLTVSSTTETDLHPGNVIYDQQGNKYIKCKNISGGDIVHKEAVMAGTSAAGLQRGYYIPGVIKAVTPSNTALMVGVNNTGLTVANNAFFWVKARGVLTCLGGTTGNLTVGDFCYASATAGEVDDDSTGATTCFGKTLTARTGAGEVIVLRE